MKVQKKNGTTEAWDFSKIVAAAKKAANRANKEFTPMMAVDLETLISEKLDKKNDISVVRLHDVVEDALSEIDHDIGQSYEQYRNYKKEFVKSWEELFQKSRDVLYLGDRENANFNSALNSTKGSLVRGYLTKELYRKFYLSKKELTAIDKGYIYIHDLRDLIFGSFNCCLFDIGAILEGGFEMSNVKYKEPKSVLSALQVIGDIILVATAQQFGGFTVPEIDKILIPYVKKSEEKYYREAEVFVIEDVEKYVQTKVMEELMQGFQSIEMKLNTVPSSRGDTAFVTFSFANVDNLDLRDNAIQRKIAKAILVTRMNGQGNGSPVVFPKLVYLYSKQQHQIPSQKDLFDVAIECSSMSMYPDFLSLDNGYVGDVYKKTRKPISPMGCRAYLSDYVDEETGEHIFVGRANIGAVSLNLPMIWKKSEGVNFYQDLDLYLEMIREFLKKRYDVVADTQCSTNPLAFTQGGIFKGYKKPEDKIGHDIVKSFTASFGITSLNELNVLMEGKPLHESDQKAVTEVVKYIRAKVDQFKAEDNKLYALYATPAESLAGTQLKQFREEFGVIDGVSDREYFSNGFHCHVSAEITPFEKQDKEFNLFHEINGGHIQYVRLDNKRNKEAIRSLVIRGMEMGFYQGINFDLVVCEECGYRPSSIVDECPHCKSDNITVISRTCGYLGILKSHGETRFNESKVAEILDRKSM